jgi:hypothetical protein
MISARCPNIPVPKIYASSADGRNPFVAQEFIDGEPLSTIWHRYTETEKHAVALKIAEIIVDMAETRFSAIGGFASPAGSILGPTIEGSKLFKGRVSRPFVLILLIINLLDRVNFIPIEATPSVHTKPQRDTFSLATTKKYTTIPASDIDPDLFEVTFFAAATRQEASARDQLRR